MIDPQRHNTDIIWWNAWHRICLATAIAIGKKDKFQFIELETRMTKLKSLSLR